MKAFASYFLFLLLAVQCAFGQHYGFIPGNTYSTELPMNQYSVHQINIQNLENEDALITWRLIENTCPTEWEFVLCDWAHCYDGMPNTGNMYPVAPQASGLLKLTVHPFDVPGSGYLHFYVFPTGYTDDRTDVFFYFHTAVLSDYIQAERTPFLYPQPADQMIFFKNFPADFFEIYDVNGKKIKALNHANHDASGLNVAAWPPGIYFFKTTTGLSGRFLVDHP